jgi:uncharacterized SAM-binding protein YcdF (DUF218 family)
MDWSRSVKFIIFGLLAAWIGGFFIYLYQIYHFTYGTTAADGIVILTGGKDRIQKGIRLLENNPEKPLLITGVRTRRQLKEINFFPQYENQIELGFKATTTRENAQEISEWDKIKACSSLTVVTSHYHIPRSLLELKTMLPDIKLIPYPIISASFQKGKWVSEPSLWHVLFKEYNKYLIVSVEIRIKSLFT